MQERDRSNHVLDEMLQRYRRGGGRVQMLECAKVASCHGMEKRLKVNLRRSTWIQTRAEGIAGFRMEQGAGGMATFFSRVCSFRLFLLSVSSPLLIKVFG